MEIINIWNKPLIEFHSSIYHGVNEICLMNLCRWWFFYRSIFSITCPPIFRCNQFEFESIWWNIAFYSPSARVIFRFYFIQFVHEFLFMNFCFTIRESKWEYCLLSIHQNQLIRPSSIQLKIKDEKKKYASNLRRLRRAPPLPLISLCCTQIRHSVQFIIQTCLVVNQFSHPSPINFVQRPAAGWARISSALKYLQSPDIRQIEFILVYVLSTRFLSRNANIQ